MIARNDAIIIPEQLYINDNSRKGNSLTKGFVNTVLVAFNMQCSNLIEKVGSLNITSTQNKIYKLAENINKFSSAVGITINEVYLDLKIAELFITYEYALILEAEKEDLRVKREIIREQNLLSDELINSKNKLDKELKHFTNQLAKDANNPQLLSKIEDIKDKINRCDYRLSNQKAGFVYIISNDAMPNSYKIGVTRRLNWEDRITDLNNASVPYKFKVHCIIFSDDCFALESALHREFDKHRVNLANKKKEFFFVPLDKIEEVVKQKYEPSAKFYKDVVCEDYIISEKERNPLTNQ